MNASPIRFVYGEVERIGERESGNILFDRRSRLERETVEAGTRTDGSHAVEDINASLQAKEGSEVAGSGAQPKPNAPDNTPPKTVKWQSMPDLTPTSTAPAVTTPQPVWKPFPRESPLTPASTSPFDPPPPEPRLPPLPCFLAVSPSGLNHATYISRQYYHGSFHPSSRTISGEDLEFRVPLAGYADLSLDKAEVPLRIRSKREREGRRGVVGEMGGLRGLWERAGGGRERIQGRESGVVWSSMG